MRLLPGWLGAAQSKMVSLHVCFWQAVSLGWAQLVYPVSSPCGLSDLFPWWTLGSKNSKRASSNIRALPASALHTCCITLSRFPLTKASHLTMPRCNGELGIEKQTSPLYGKGQSVIFFCRLPQPCLIPSVFRIKPKIFSSQPYALHDLFSNCLPMTYPMQISCCSYSRVLLLLEHLSSAQPLPMLFPLFAMSFPLPTPMHPCLMPNHSSWSSSKVAFPRSIFCFISVWILPLLQISEPLLASLWQHVLPVVCSLSCAHGW